MFWLQIEHLLLVTGSTMRSVWGLPLVNKHALFTFEC